MKITIRKPFGYSQIGRKDQQEDAVWPLFEDASAENPCFVLCDGVGGSLHGELASQTASEVIGEYLTNIVKEKQSLSDADVQDAVNLAYDELEKIDTEATDDGAISMATTLTCVCLHSDGVIATHMGDSRIYLIRPGVGLLYQSADHSLVKALLQSGELTPEEAKTFKRKNVITKAIQPHGNKRFKAEVHQLTDIKAGDYLFLCCDGVLEQLTNERLVEILSMSCSDEEKIKLLEAESTDKTKDNYTAYLIPIDDVEGESTLVHEDEEATVVAVEATKEQTETTEEKVNPANQVVPSRQVVDKKTVLPTRTRRPTAPVAPTKSSKSSSALKVLLMALALIAIAATFAIKKGIIRIDIGTNDTIENKGNSMFVEPTVSRPVEEKKDSNTTEQSVVRFPQKETHSGKVNP